jgi:hypothetical protein
MKVQALKKENRRKDSTPNEEEFPMTLGATENLIAQLRKESLENQWKLDKKSLNLVETLLQQSRMEGRWSSGIEFAMQKLASSIYKEKGTWIWQWDDDLWLIRDEISKKT